MPGCLARLRWPGGSRKPAQARLAQRKSAAFTRRRSGGRHVDRALTANPKRPRDQTVNLVTSGFEPRRRPSCRVTQVVNESGL
jgi:hypothetical protein